MQKQNNKKLDRERLIEQMRTFIGSFKSLHYAVVTPEGLPEVGYAPFVLANDPYAFLVYVSDLAKSARNLKRSGVCTVFFIEAEEQAEEVFARKRVTLVCQAQVIARDEVLWSSYLDQFQEQFGEVVQTLRSLTDFDLIRLVPGQGRYVTGFAQAYSVVEKDF